VYNILQKTEFPNSDVANALAEASIASGFEEFALTIPTLSDEFLIKMFSRKLSASTAQILVSRSLSSKVKEFVLQSNETRVSVLRAFLHANRLTRSEVDFLLAKSNKELECELVHYQPHVWTYEEFKTFCTQNSKFYIFAIGLLNFDNSFAAKDFLSLVERVVTTESLSFPSRNSFVEQLSKDANSFAALHSSVLFGLERLRDFTFEPSRQAAIMKHQLFCMYYHALSSASFKEAWEFDRHFDVITKMLPKTNSYVRKELAYSLHTAVLNPRISTNQAIGLLEFVEKQDGLNVFEPALIKEIRVARSEAAQQGFDVFYGPYKQLPSHLHAGLFTLLNVRNSLAHDRESSLPYIEALEAPELTSGQADKLVSNLVCVPRVLEPWVSKTTAEVALSSRSIQWLESWKWKTRGVVGPKVSFQNVEWVKLACEKFGTDVTAWQVFLTLYKNFENASEKHYTELVLNASKINRV